MQTEQPGIITAPPWDGDQPGTMAEWPCKSRQDSHALPHFTTKFSNSADSMFLFWYSWEVPDDADVLTGTRTIFAIIV